MKSVRLIVPCAAAIVLAAPAIAASADYYLVIDGIDGEASSSAKISSWSFGASQPATSTGSMASGRGGSTGKPNLGSSGQDGVISPRDPSSGLATGRKSGELQAADFNRLAAMDEAQGVTLALPAQSDAAHQLCGDSNHLRSGHIVTGDGTVYDLGSLKGTCTAAASGMVSVQITGSMKHKNYTGHVTLMK
jgi:hypothetical protein